MLAAPLIAGNDLRTIQKETLDILTNKEVIAVDQDSLGIECFTLYDYGNWQIYFKPLNNGDAAMCFLNRGETQQKVEFNWKSNNVYDGDNNLSYDFNKSTYKLRDLWAKKDIGTTNDVFKSEIPPHDVILIRLSK